jgi:hypothetical protein
MLADVEALAHASLGDRTIIISQPMRGSSRRVVPSKAGQAGAAVLARLETTPEPQKFIMKFLIGGSEA